MLNVKIKLMVLNIEMRGWCCEQRDEAVGVDHRDEMMELEHRDEIDDKTHHDCQYYRYASFVRECMRVACTFSPTT